MDYPKLQNVELVSAIDANGEQYTHALEPGLAGASIPRAARITKQAKIAIRVLWNLFFLACALCVFLIKCDYAEWTRLLENGTQTTATLRGTSLASGSGMDLHYQFPADGGMVEFSVFLPASQTAKNRDHLPVTYVPGTNGSLYREGSVTARERANGVWDSLTRSLIACSLGFVIASGFRGYALGQLRLLREGVAVAGVVRSGLVSKNGNQQRYTVQYTYWAGNRKRKGKMTVCAEEYQKFTEGNPYFTVLYDASQPERHLPYHKRDCAELVAANV